ncbi:MAG: hybrid sensor histidine kinase/response regulator [Myxococcota bacterium]|nr:hybrid sensor histidine kinase/response regulator [Myxococcota bacterium]
MDDAVHGAILVVDDNAENRALAQATLEDEGYRVTVARSGEEGLARFTTDPPDCVLLDIRMPGMDGITTCQRLRQLPGGVDVPILFLTAQRDLDTFDRARDVGGDDFITKPYRPAELITRVTAAVKLRRMAAERSELYELVRRQRDDLMRLQLQKEQLIAFLVHDLKNPVNAIELHGQRIVRDRDATPRARDAAAKIQSESRALLRMIMNLLDLSKADEGHLVPAHEPVAIEPLLLQITEAMQVRAHASEVALVLTAPACSVDADPDLLRRVLENLVDNAIRHAPEGSTVQLTAETVEGALELRVADAGTGIPDELRAHVFERFTQGDSAARSGHGLGLAFCKLAVEAHGGRIWIEDASPGTVFCVRVPRG